MHDDRLSFEQLILEGAQAGLARYTILKRRDGDRAAFKNFEPAGVGWMTDVQLASVLTNGDIVRHQIKVCSA